MLRRWKGISASRLKAAFSRVVPLINSHRRQPMPQSGAEVEQVRHFPPGLLNIIAELKAILRNPEQLQARRMDPPASFYGRAHELSIIRK